MADKHEKKLIVVDYDGTPIVSSGAYVTRDRVGVYPFAANTVADGTCILQATAMFYRDKCYAEGVEAELKAAALRFVKWIPTSDNINSLPAPLRKYIHDLETMCDPAGMVQEIAALKENVAALSAEHEQKSEPMVLPDGSRCAIDGCGYGMEWKYTKETPPRLMCPKHFHEHLEQQDKQVTLPIEPDHYVDLLTGKKCRMPILHVPEPVTGSATCKGDDHEVEPEQLIQLASLYGSAPDATDGDGDTWQEPEPHSLTPPNYARPAEECTDSNKALEPLPQPIETSPLDTDIILCTKDGRKIVGKRMLNVAGCITEEEFAQATTYISFSNYDPPDLFQDEDLDGWLPMEVDNASI